MGIARGPVVGLATAAAVAAAVDGCGSAPITVPGTPAPASPDRAATAGTTPPGATPPGATAPRAASGGDWPIVAGGAVLPAEQADEPYVSYAIASMGCAEAEGGPGLGIRVNDAVFGDATGDGAEDAVVALECVPSTSGWPETVLVLDGAAGRRGAPIAGVLIDGTQTPTRLDATSIEVGPGSVAVAGNDYGYAPGPEPQSTFTRTFQWDGFGFVEVSAPQDPAPPVPSSCPAAVTQAIGEPADLVQAYRTDRSAVSVCVSRSGALYYFGSSPAGDIVLPALALGGGAYQASNTADGSVYTYTIDDYALLVTRDGAVLFREPVDPCADAGPNC